jgi:dipeptidyl aminopeptidase/acylaminoacyl peptidase
MKTTKAACRILWILLIATACVATRASTANYLDAVFAPPTDTELAAAYARIQYEPRCVDFKLGEVFEDADAYTIYKVAYTSDGLKQTGLFARPKSGGPFPLLMLNHGGFSGIGKLDIPKIKEYLSNGYAVAMATYRGEAGQAGRAEGTLDILGDEMHDVLNLMECAAAQENVDPDRIVAYGGSHGAGLTLSALTQTRRIKAAAAASAPAGLLNDKIQTMAAKWRTQPGSTEVLLNIFITREGITVMKKILGIKENDPARIPAVRFEIFRRSPVLFADRIVTPLLMYYGEKDPVTSAADGKIIADSLQKRGVPVKLTVFPGSGHSYSPKEMDQTDSEILEFLDSYVKPK